MSEKYELWSWNEPNRQWLAVDQGTEAEVLAGVERRTASARKFGLWGAAFVGCKAGAGPTAPPAELGIDVVAEPESEPQPVSVGDGTAALDRLLRFAGGDAATAEVTRLRGIEQRARAELDIALDPGSAWFYPMDAKDYCRQLGHILTGDVDE